MKKWREEKKARQENSLRDCAHRERESSFLHERLFVTSLFFLFFIVIFLLLLFFCRHSFLWRLLLVKWRRGRTEEEEEKKKKKRKKGGVRSEHLSTPTFSLLSFFYTLHNSFRHKPSTSCHSFFSLKLDFVHVSTTASSANAPWPPCGKWF